ncbi:unnamed protein product [Urochloa decumbens]|uniref:Uncharacterized protein n=1 Tax=Urochloa decumbens TaxID=240449 RepID=A0ABC9BSM6_9POAL
MALKASISGLVVLCLVSLLFVSTFAHATARAHDAGRKMKRGLLAADVYPPTYGGTPILPPVYGTPSPPVPTYTPTPTQP